MRRILLASMAFMSFSGLASGEVLRVYIPIKGALCAFCMAGIEKRYRERAPGLTHYRLSIRERMVDLWFDGNHTVDVEGLRKVIADYGYTPQEATVTLRGRAMLSQDEGRKPEVRLRGLEAEKTYRIAPGGPERSGPYEKLLKSAERGEVVTVTGRLDMRSEPPTLDLELVGENTQSAEDEGRQGDRSEAVPPGEARVELQSHFRPEHFLEHRSELELSREQVASLENLRAGLEERRRKTAEIVAHCGSEVTELLARMATREDEESIRHEVEEIAQARKQLERAEAEAGLAAWKSLSSLQRRKWFGILSR